MARVEFDFTEMGAFFTRLKKAAQGNFKKDAANLGNFSPDDKKLVEASLREVLKKQGIEMPSGPLMTVSEYLGKDKGGETVER